MAVQIVDMWGSIIKLAKTANLSYGGTKSYTEETAKELISRIVKLGHTSVLEFGGATFYVKAPIYTARQWMRHRHFSFLEKSGRYTKFTEDSIPKNAEKNLREEMEKQLKIYKELLKTHKKEDARMVLGTGFLTEFYVSGNLRTWLNFLQQRTSQKAQEDIRNNAIQIKEILNNAWAGIFTEELLSCNY